LGGLFIATTLFLPRGLLGLLRRQRRMHDVRHYFASGTA
jgi:hypothetical protein